MGGRGFPPGAKQPSGSLPVQGGTEGAVHAEKRARGSRCPARPRAGPDGPGGAVWFFIDPSGSRLRVDFGGGNPQSGGYRRCDGGAPGRACRGGKGGRALTGASKSTSPPFVPFRRTLGTGRMGTDAGPCVAPDGCRAPPPRRENDRRALVAEKNERGRKGRPAADEPSLARPFVAFGPFSATSGIQPKGNGRGIVRRIRRPLSGPSRCRSSARAASEDHRVHAT